MPVAPLFRASSSAIALNQVQLAAIGMFLRAIGQLAGEGAVEDIFALDEIAGGAGGLASAGGELALLDDRFGLAGRLLQVAGEHLRGDGFYDRAHLGVVQL